MNFGVDEMLLQYLREDVGWGDITTEHLGIKGEGRGRILSRERCVVAGIWEAKRVFELAGASAKAFVGDGGVVEKNGVVMEVWGDIRSILMAERVALNIMSKMSGIATTTRRFVEEAKKVNPNVKVAATRKTTPGFRYFEKKAVVLGGGVAHRWALYDAVLIKDNHLAVVGSVAEAVRRAKRRDPYHVVEVEVENISDALEAVRAGADVVMLDNMGPDDAKKAYEEIKRLNEKVVVEVSGGITFENIAAYAPCADVISTSKITIGARPVDFTLELER